MWHSGGEKKSEIDTINSAKKTDSQGDRLFFKFNFNFKFDHRSSFRRYQASSAMPASVPMSLFLPHN